MGYLSFLVLLICSLLCFHQSDVIYWFRLVYVCDAWRKHYKCFSFGPCGSKNLTCIKIAFLSLGITNAISLDVDCFIKIVLFAFLRTLDLLKTTRNQGDNPSRLFQLICHSSRGVDLIHMYSWFVFFSRWVSWIQEIIMYQDRPFCLFTTFTPSKDNPQSRWWPYSSVLADLS